MILVLLGTHELQFTRLLKDIEKCIDNGGINEEVLVQTGNTKYQSDKMKMIDYISYDQLTELTKKADFIITHGGTGSIVTSLRMDKKVIAVPRLKKYNEHNDDHQMEILNVFSEKGYIIIYSEHDSLEEKIKELKKFEPQPFSSDNSKMVEIIKNFINKN